MSGPDGLAVRAVAPADRDAFEARDGPGYCWCMVFRHGPALAR